MYLRTSCQGYTKPDLDLAIVFILFVLFDIVYWTCWEQFIFKKIYLYFHPNRFIFYSWSFIFHKTM